MDASFSMTLLLVVPLLLVPLFFVYRSSRSSTKVNRDVELYGLWHLALNRLPHEPPDKPPATEWLNMGYWKDETSFPGACRALAYKLARAAKLKSGANVLDVGFGTGESLLFLLSDPSVPRPSKLTGITYEPAQCERARQRLNRAHPAWMDDEAKRVFLLSGDAIDGGTPGHPLSLSNPDPFDAILALDCAYHFKTRQKFLQQSFSRLAPGGRVALADICFSSQALNTFSSRLVTSLLRMMPLCNRISMEEYHRQMLEVGYEDIKIEDITPDVFPSFVAFLKGQGWGWWFFARIFQYYADSGAHYVIVSGQRP